ncbi:unnamed protein product [Symbiodinium sp. CCMP2592]|nr:unnamed protein product [Symbiodinium sp. CCMP2592]
MRRTNRGDNRRGSGSEAGGRRASTDAGSMASSSVMAPSTRMRNKWPDGTVLRDAPVLDEEPDKEAEEEEETEAAEEEPDDSDEDDMRSSKRGPGPISIGGRRVVTSFYNQRDLNRMPASWPHWCIRSVMNNSMQRRRKTDMLKACKAEYLRRPAADVPAPMPDWVEGFFKDDEKAFPGGKNKGRKRSDDEESGSEHQIVPGSPPKDDDDDEGGSDGDDNDDGAVELKPTGFKLSRKVQKGETLWFLQSSEGVKVELGTPDTGTHEWHLYTKHGKDWLWTGNHDEQEPEECVNVMNELMTTEDLAQVGAARAEPPACKGLRPIGGGDGTIVAQDNDPAALSRKLESHLREKGVSPDKLKLLDEIFNSSDPPRPPVKPSAKVPKPTPTPTSGTPKQNLKPSTKGHPSKGKPVVQPAGADAGRGGDDEKRKKRAAQEEEERARKLQAAEKERLREARRKAAEDHRRKEEELEEQEAVRKATALAEKLEADMMKAKQAREKEQEEKVKALAREIYNKRMKDKGLTPEGDVITDEEEKDENDRVEKGTRARSPPSTGNAGGAGSSRDVPASTSPRSGVEDGEPAAKKIKIAEDGEPPAKRTKNAPSTGEELRPRKTKLPPPKGVRPIKDEEHPVKKPKEQLLNAMADQNATLDADEDEGENEDEETATVELEPEGGIGALDEEQGEDNDNAEEESAMPVAPSEEAGDDAEAAETEELPKKSPKKLWLNLTAEWYEKIKNGEKSVELRKATEHWAKRIRGASQAMVLRGYDKTTALPKKISKVEHLPRDRALDWGVPRESFDFLFGNESHIFVIHLCD